MTPVQQALAAGFSALRGVAGRLCMFRGDFISFVLDETGGQFDTRRGTPDFNARTGIIAECLVADANPVPRAGESFTDDTGRVHRIASVERRGDWWRITCKPATATDV